jgi:DMSO/TMAO reductase YedYZ molybdopterin-dependent catalytic subunit
MLALSLHAHNEEHPMLHKLIVSSVLLCTAPVAFAADTGISVTGLVSHPLHLTLADLKGFPATKVSATQVSGRGPVALDCSGAALSAVLAKAVLNVGTANNAKLAHSVLFTADDGYAVALSLGEIDPDYGNEAPIIATDCGGKPLDAPRLIVPNDKHGGRAVKGLVSMEVK